MLFNKPNVIGVMNIKVYNKKSNTPKKDHSAPLKFSLAPLMFKAFADKSRKKNK